MLFRSSIIFPNAEDVKHNQHQISRPRILFIVSRAVESRICVFIWIVSVTFVRVRIMLRKKRHCFVTCGVILRFVFYTRTRDTLIMTIVTILIVVEVTFSASQHTNRKMFFLNCVNCVDIIVICCGILGLVLFVARFDHHVREYAECK